MGKIPSGAWVVVGDGEKALFLKNEGDEAFPNLAVIRAEQQDNPPTREQGTDRPGAEVGSPQPGQRPVQQTDWHRMEKERFAKEMADWLYKAAHRGEYDALIVAAPPMVLGELRKALHKEVESRIVFDVPKELTNHPVHEIEQVLSNA